MNRPTYRQSGLGHFDFCAYAYYLDDIERKRGLGNFFTCRGNGTHHARKINFRQKIKSRKDLPLAEMQDAARDKVRSLVMDNKVNLRCRELCGLNKAAAAALIIDTTVKLVEADRDRLQCNIQPIEVECQRKIVLANWGFDLQCRLDSIDEQHFIDDLKTSKRVWTQANANTEYQPSIYKLSHRATFGFDPAGFRYHCLIISGKRHNIKAYVLKTNRTDKQIVAVLERFKTMHKCIERGAFPPASPKSWKCSPDWCEWYNDCKYVGNG